MPIILDDLKLQSGSFSAIFRPTALNADRVFTPPDKSGTFLVNSDIGTIAIQNANAVAFTGGSINGVAIGSITPNTVAATTVNASSSTASTSTTTGAIVTPGGVGAGGSLFLGGGVNAISAAFRSGSFTSAIVPTTLSANQTILTPNQSGTIALLSDIAAATGVQKLYVNNVASAVLTGTLVETTFLTFTIPANTVGVNGCLDIEELLNGITNNANVKTLRVKIGANIIIAAPVTNFASYGTRRTLRCQNSQSSQLIYAPASAAGTGGSTLSASGFNIDFTVDQVVTVTGQLTVATDSMQLRGTTVLLY